MDPSDSPLQNVIEQTGWVAKNAPPSWEGRAGEGTAVQPVWMLCLDTSHGDEQVEEKFRLNVWENLTVRIIKQHKILLRKREGPVLGVFKISLDNALNKRNCSKTTKQSRDYTV